MSYFFSKKIKGSDFNSTIEKVSKNLKDQGFGVITEVDIKDTLKKKIDVDFRKYTILGACHPQTAHKALKSESKIGVFLPCNIVVEESEPGTIEVAVVDPVASMQSVENEALGVIAKEVQDKLKKVLEEL